MTQAQLQTNLISYFDQGTFIAALFFAVVYQLLKFRWWESVTGRAWMALALSVAGTLLHPVLIAWGVPPVPQGRAPWYDVALTWFAVLSVGVVGVAILVLAWQAVRLTVAEEQHEQQENGGNASWLIRKLVGSPTALRFLKIDTVRHFPARHQGS
jgi:hypothetical protein